MSSPPMTTSPMILGPAPPLASAPKSDSMKFAWDWSTAPLFWPKHRRTFLMSRLTRPLEIRAIQSAVSFAPSVSSHSFGHFLMKTDSLPKRLWHERPDHLFDSVTFSQISMFSLVWVAEAESLPRSIAVDWLEFV